MSLVNLNKWLVLVANIGVVVGIFVLVVEVRQNQIILQQNQQISILDSLNTDVQHFHDWRELMIQDEEVAQIWMNGLSGEELTPVQESRFSYLCSTLMWTSASMYERSVVLGTEKAARSTVNTIRRQVENLPRIERCWERYKVSIRAYGFDGFVDSVDAGN